MKLLAATLLVALAATACGAGNNPEPRRGSVSRSLGQWRGAESQTVGFVSESGRLRIAWTARTLATGAGTFRVTLHSAVSGRPLAVLTEQVADGHSDVSEDPRPYSILIEAAGVAWTIAVDELVAAPAPISSRGRVAGPRQEARSAPRAPATLTVRDWVGGD